MIMIDSFYGINSIDKQEDMNEMKVLEGLEALKYIALYKVFMYNRTGNRTYRLTLNYIIEKTVEDYGIEGLTELLDFIQAETE